MSSVFHPAIEIPILEGASERVRTADASLGAFRPLAIAATGTVLFVGTVTLLSQLMSPAWVASQFAW